MVVHVHVMVLLLLVLAFFLALCLARVIQNHCIWGVQELFLKIESHHLLMSGRWGHRWGVGCGQQSVICIVCVSEGVVQGSALRAVARREGRGPLGTGRG